MSDVSPGERLTDVILSNRMTKKEFAAALGYNPSYITQICLNIKQPSREFASKVEACFGVPVEWLLHGKENTEAPKSQEHRSPLKEALLAKIEAISSENELRAVLSYIKCYEEMSTNRLLNMRGPVRLNSAPRMFSVPIKGEVAGGLPITAHEERDEMVETPVFADSALYLKGKSMEPDYPDGALLLIKENAYVTNGDVVIALIMKEAEVAEATCKVFHKRRGKITLSPINPDFEEQTYSEKDGGEIKIFGKVIGVAEQ